MENILSYTAGFFSGIVIVLVFGINRFISLNKQVAGLNAQKETLENALLKEISSLQTHIKLLAENNQQICKEANNLADALKGQNKVQGDWGETILTRLLEISGLTEGLHYKVQQTFRDGQNKSVRPDVVVNLPDNRHIIIDSKVSLISYERFYNTQNENELHYKDFENSVKEHIKNLRGKFYQEIKGINTPDFVLMFIPIEGAFNLIFSRDTELINFAWQSKIILVSPSTLISTLKLVELFWRQEKQNQNVIEIAEESGKLYDKFVGLLGDLENIRLYFDKTIECFDSARRKLYGRGNLINHTEKIRGLGAKTSKSIPEKYLIDEMKEPEEKIY